MYNRDDNSCPNYRRGISRHDKWKNMWMRQMLFQYFEVFSTIFQVWVNVRNIWSRKNVIEGFQYGIILIKNIFRCKGIGRMLFRRTYPYEIRNDFYKICKSIMWQIIGYMFKTKINTVGYTRKKQKSTYHLHFPRLFLMLILLFHHLCYLFWISYLFWLSSFPFRPFLFLLFL